MTEGSLQVIDQRSDAGRAEAVVDVDHGDIRRAGVQHAQQRGHAAERSAIADAGGNRQHRRIHQARRQPWATRPPCPAHTISTRADLQRMFLRQQAMNAGHAHIGDQFDPCCPSGARSPRLLRRPADRWCPRRPRRWFPSRRGGSLRERDGARRLVILGARLHGGYGFEASRARRAWPAHCRRPAPCAQRSCATCAAVFPAAKITSGMPVRSAR